MSTHSLRRHIVAGAALAGVSLLASLCADAGITRVQVT